MRLVIVAMLLVSSTALMAQERSGPAVYAPPGTDASPFLYSVGTPTMLRERQAREARGRAFLAERAFTEDDLRALAQACGRTVRQPDYCAVPGMRQLGGPDALYASTGW